MTATESVAMRRCRVCGCDDLRASERQWSMSADGLRPTPIVLPVEKNPSPEPVQEIDPWWTAVVREPGVDLWATLDVSYNRVMSLGAQECVEYRSTATQSVVLAGFRSDGRQLRHGRVPLQDAEGDVRVSLQFGLLGVGQKNPSPEPVHEIYPWPAAPASECAEASSSALDVLDNGAKASCAGPRLVRVGRSLV